MLIFIFFVPKKAVKKYNFYHVLASYFLIRNLSKIREKKLKYIEECH